MPGPSRIWTDVDLDREGRSLGYFRLNVSSHERPSSFVPIPVASFKNGSGPRILLLGGVHGDEFEGQVLLMKLMRALDVENVRGQLIILSAANAPAAFAGRRTSPLDEKNLNREYPGDPRGSPTQEIAHLIDSVLLPRVDYLFDFHSGSISTRFVPSAHVYHSPDEERFNRLLRMLEVFGMPTSVVLQGLIDHDKKVIGTCDRLGVLRFSSELGGGGGITIDALRRAEHGLARLLYEVGALREPITHEPASPVELVRRLPNRAYVYAMASGVFEPYVDIGAEVQTGQAAGAIHFPEEPWREPALATFSAGGTVHAVRTHALTQMGDMLFMLHVPWGEPCSQLADKCALSGTPLQPGETLRVAEGVPHIVYYRPGAQERPLAVFLPGGGHLARVAYGHVGAERRDFIDAWLEDEGHGLLALSYPSDHAAFQIHWTDLSITAWASSVAELIREYLQMSPAREFFVIGWSQAGRSVVAIERALRLRELEQLCFVSLAATAPLPNLLPARTSSERFTREGFWDSGTRHRQWLQQVERQVGAAGRPAIDAKTYLSHYVVNSPFPLRGQSLETTAGAELVLAEEIGAFAWEDYPLVAAIVPEDVEDRLHALTDRAMWGAVNVQRIARGLAGRTEAKAESWAALRDLINQLPQRLSRGIAGGHFFFIGEAAARATVRHILDLTSEVRTLRLELQALVATARSSTIAR